MLPFCLCLYSLAPAAFYTTVNQRGEWHCPMARRRTRGLPHVLWHWFFNWNLKVSGNPCDDHNLTSIAWKKKHFYSFFFISLHNWRLKSINWFMNYSIDISSSGVKFALHLIHFVTNIELYLHKTTKFFSYFLHQPVKIKCSKNPCPRFSISFLFFVILAYITFFFPLKSVLKSLNIIRLQRILSQEFYFFIVILKQPT